MKFIKSIKIHSFRSCKKIDIEDCDDFNVFMGLNNSGKSNILRALNLFFNGEIEPGYKFLLERDGNFPEKRREKKEVKITITFDTKELKKSPQFKKVVHNIDDNYEITKIWGYQEPQEGVIVVKRKDQLDKAQSFLKFIRFRYLIAHRDPAKIIFESEKRIRKELLRRFNSRVKKSKTSPASINSILKILGDTSKALVDPIALPVKEISPEISDLKLLTPKIFEDLVISLGYAVQLKNKKIISEELQGSGFQSHLMFRVLYFADTAYSLDFGWKGVTVWAIEEPESFLHKNLEIELGRFFDEICKKSRMQIFCTTHSETFPQYSNNTFLLKFDDLKYSQLEREENKKIIAKSSMLGVSQFVHALHFQQAFPLILLEGETDKKIIQKAMQLAQKNNSFIIFDNNDLDLTSGGVAQLLKYLEENIQVINSRQKPIHILLDWDVSESEKKHFDKLGENVKVYRFDETKCNPNLDETFRGIERFLSEKIIKGAASQNNFKYQTDAVNTNILSIKRKTLNDNKNKIADYFVKNATKQDLLYLKPEIENALKTKIASMKK